MFNFLCKSCAYFVVADDVLLCVRIFDYFFIFITIHLSVYVHFGVSIVPTSNLNMHETKQSEIHIYKKRRKTSKGQSLSPAVVSPSFLYNPLHCQSGTKEIIVNLSMAFVKLILFIFSLFCRSLLQEHQR